MSASGLGCVKPLWLTPESSQPPLLQLDPFVLPISGCFAVSERLRRSPLLFRASW
jgi:hypothetical protein